MVFNSSAKVNDGGANAAQNGGGNSTLSTNGDAVSCNITSAKCVGI